MQDKRVHEFVEFVREQQGKFDLWHYLSNPRATRWLTFDLIRSLSKLDEVEEWISSEPKTPFQAYKKKEKRY